jgi:hypothetical protein
MPTTRSLSVADVHRFVDEHVPHDDDKAGGVQVGMRLEWITVAR